MAGYQWAILCLPFCVFGLISFSNAAVEEESTHNTTPRELNNGVYNAEEQLDDPLPSWNITLKGFLRGNSFHRVQSFNYPCGGLFACYIHFRENIGTTYHALCLARGKLKKCKHVVFSGRPLILNECSIDNSEELESDYFCNHPNGSFMYMEFEKCPFVKPVIPLSKDFSIYTHVKKSRSDMAMGILQQTGAIQGYHCMR